MYADETASTKCNFLFGSLPACQRGFFDTLKKCEAFRFAFFYKIIEFQKGSLYNGGIKDRELAKAGGKGNERYLLRSRYQGAV
jgi:hypothetical protein